MPHPYMRTGFTLIELMVTISVAAILLVIAVPNFQTFVLNNRITGQANDMMTALNYARSEAIKRGLPVSMCSSIPTGATSICAGSTNWGTGWIVFADPNNNGTLDPGETLLRVWPALGGGNTLNTGLAAVTSVTFDSGGFARGSVTTFRLCDSRGTGSARNIQLAGSGRAKVATGAASCP